MPGSLQTSNTHLQNFHAHQNQISLLTERSPGFLSPIRLYHKAHTIVRSSKYPGTDLARMRANLDGVSMGIRSYHPGWVYHGLIVGPLRDAALLLDRLMTGALLSPDLLAQMRDAQPLDVPDQTQQGHQQRPWRAPAYGLGLMGGVTSHGMRACGHTGRRAGQRHCRLPPAGRGAAVHGGRVRLRRRPGAGRGKNAEPVFGVNLTTPSACGAASRRRTTSSRCS